MSDDITPVNVRILGKDYRIACAEEERDDLLESARYLDQKMREVRDTGRVSGHERIAVMAALNIVHELTQVNRQKSSPAPDFHERVVQIQKKIDAVLDVEDSE